MQADADGSVELLLARTPPVPPDAALAALHSAAPALAAPYLEAAIQAGIASAQDFHSTLAGIYMAALAAAAPAAPRSPHAAAPPPPASAEEQLHTRKLLAIIKDSPHVRPEELLGQMPDAPTRSLLLARAALHERQHQFQAALDVYAHQLCDHAAAEAFADRLYDGMMVRLLLLLPVWRACHLCCICTHACTGLLSPLQPIMRGRAPGGTVAPTLASARVLHGLGNRVETRAHVACSNGRRRGSPGRHRQCARPRLQAL